MATRNVYGDEAAAEVAAFDPTIVMHHEGGWQVVVDQAAGAASEVAKACTVCGDPASSSPDCLGCTGAAGAARAGAVGAVGAVEAKNGAAVGALENTGEEGGDPTTKAECTRMIEVARKAKKKREVRRREKRDQRTERRERVLEYIYNGRHCPLCNSLPFCAYCCRSYVCGRPG